MEYTKGEWYLELRPTDNVRRVRCNSETIGDVFGTNAEDKGNAHLIIDAVNACQKVNPNNPLAVAEGIPDLYEALREMMERFNRGTRFPLQSTCDKANQALSKVETKNATIK